MEQIYFGEIAEFRNGLNYGKDSYGKGSLLIGIPDFKDRFKPDYKSLGEINPIDIIKEEDYLNKNDIIFVRSNGNKALVGRSLFIDRDIKAVFSGFCIRARLTSQIIIPLFCAYFTRTDRFKSLIASSGGTSIQNLNQRILANVKIPLFSIKKQNQITKVLSDLDSKIAINNKINAALEAMAKTLYDYWFVQFDFPDKNGKPYKSSEGKMIFNEELKREIPVGWEVKKLKEIAKTGSGGTPLKSKKEYYDKGNISWINSGEVNASFIISAKKYITQLGLDKSSAKLFKKGTILMAMYGATAGQVSLIDFEACTNQAICGINPIDEKLKYYTKFSLEDLYQYLINLSTGSARDNLSQDKIKELNIIIPNEALISAFHNNINSNFDEILLNLKQNQKLSELRDWLLPMLMNGQVSVGE
ncbi:restriction endonuclease subunit S [Tenacibaculum finnmarkense]|uniref:restriction endonuclease subunit S n=1 Tax=Tenacibaculum finnmarkense TaxID=2781243 RepID=UPI001EFB9DEE|nr:restriction endonuclease subunit S [Tenacibaculum finnmarkense]MCG8206170.1 restriction endonuclease subunit S [Tenacibaculum finnmarkense genomovar finnmarkense]MCG8722325.1 restriction endonuclease subunit S [Tenacibaculum finnmarkense]MCG8740544.1 restriction endonuclease subunit S [Tenacibaculum finnmarkense]MCG8763994.1 restriction endonuclease subunit S [Tenacibaculum finnmarkense]MCG8776796.1 restriction endonuclease subunit S [Tenacibaculum finnmarkense]